MIISNQLRKPNPEHPCLPAAGTPGQNHAEVSQAAVGVGVGQAGGLWGSPRPARSPGEESGFICPPAVWGDPKIVIHSANTDGYSLHTGHCSRPGDSAVTRWTRSLSHGASFPIGAEVGDIQ